jgi:hypothetical protein
MVYDLFDRAVLPEVVEELGMAGDRSATPRLMRIVENQSPDPAQPYLQIKAIEALGRLREPKAEALLRSLAESKRHWRWMHSRELRITAVQALEKIDPEWAKGFLPRCGLSEAELNLTAIDPDPECPWLRQRRYLRVNLLHPIRAIVRSGVGAHQVSLRQLSLGGGVGKSQCLMRPGTIVPLEFQSGLHRIDARVLLRETRPPQELTFELSQISLDARNHWRRPLTGLYSKED